MPLMCVACTCGSVDALIRTRLDRCGYSDFLTIPITRGKTKSKNALSTLPQLPELTMLLNHLDKASKYAIVVGYDDEGMRWVDLANGKAFMNNVDLENVVERFA